MENPCESIYEQMMPEYSLEAVWTEPVLLTGDASFNERASKFFCITDLYNQRYVCYLLSSKCQLRCLKVECESVSSSSGGVEVVATPGGLLNYIPAKDAVFVENRNLMVNIILYFIK